MIFFLFIGVLVIWGIWDFIIALLYFMMSLLYLIFGFIPNLIRYLCHQDYIEPTKSTLPIHTEATHQDLDDGIFRWPTKR